MRPFLALTLAAAVMLSGCGTRDQSAAPAPKPTPAKITMFYASPPHARPGEPVKLCYGVEGAREVRLEPPVEEITPSFSRCIDLKAQKTEEYKLIARSAGGDEVTQSVQLVVSGPAYRPPSASAGAGAAAEGGGGGLIQTFAAASSSASPGQPVTLCYVVANGATGEVSPGGGPLRGPKGCLTVKPQQTTTYTLTARAGGATETQKLTVRVGQ